jgi:hypothetical protein
MPAPFPQTPTLKWRNKPSWDNWHKTVSQPIEGIYTPHYPADNPPYTAAVLNACTQDIQLAIAVAKERSLRLRAAGSAWSLSTAGVTNGIMLDTSFLKGWFKINPGNLDPGYQGTARSGLFFFQCGTLIAEVNKTIESDTHRRSLRTTGAANGQTIVGATATGTHGSALGFGAAHDQIVAIHLLAGPQKQFLLERASYPVLKQAFADALNAELVRDDDLFNAAVMSFGSMGVIHNVVIETRPRFLLDAETHAPVPFDQDLRNLIATLDPERHPRLRGKGQPYFLQVVVNPHSNDAMINVMYEQRWKDGHVPDYRLKAGKVGPGYDALGLVGKVFETSPALIPSFFKLVSTVIDTKPKLDRSWGELFGYKAPQTKVASGSIAVALADALATLDILGQVNAQHPAPLVYGCRFVKRSPALLAFNRFDTTFVVSLDGVFNNQSVDFFRRSAAALDQAGIRYTQHWGKANAYTGPRIRQAYGDGAVDKWLAARHRLLPSARDRAIFTNPFMEERGLAG